MALFNLTINRPGNDDDSSKDDDKSLVILQYNAASVTVPAAEAEGRTIQELFEEYAEDLDDADISGSTFMKAGQVVNGSAEVKPGTVYRACVTSDTKGA
jgi:hypothetical protein